MTKTDLPFNRDIRRYLKRELMKRQKRHPRYSARAFAAFLGMSHSFLLKVLEGKNLLSEEKLEYVGRKLKINPVILENLKMGLRESRQKRLRKNKSKMASRFLCL